MRPEEPKANRNDAPGAIAYRPDLDGLRAIAIGLVLITHAKWPWPNNGGDFGVTAFFVLSGYLITGILLRELQRTGRIDVMRFYRRRVVRLAPALLALLAFTLVLGLVIRLPNGWALGLLSCLAYVSNWVQVAGTNIDPLGHTWSLAIEEQFYLLWPAALLLLRGRALSVAVVIIVVAGVIRLVEAGPFEYFSTVTRADAILLGCVVALIRPTWPAAVGAIGLAALVILALVVPDNAHDAAIPLAMSATVAVIGGEFRPLGRLAPIGLRAYSLYLWDWPMTVLFGAPGILAPVMTVLLAEVSFRLFEIPVLHRGARAAQRAASESRAASAADIEPRT